MMLKRALAGRHFSHFRSLFVRNDPREIVPLEREFPGTR